MTTKLGPAALRSLLDQPDPHEITAAAHAARVARFGPRTSCVAVAHLDPSSSASYCPVTGEMAPEGGFARELSALPDRATELCLIAPDAADAVTLIELVRSVPRQPEVTGFAATVQLGSLDDWARVGASALEAATAHGVRSVSDGVHPQVHPVRGRTEEWADAWRVIAALGLRGHATVLYGPQHGLDSVFAQLEAIAAVQRETGVFLSIAPCIFDEEKFGGPDDHLLTHASLDLRVLAACRLFDTGVDHVSIRYERSDLKSAHTALACGADDLIGHLHLWPRDKKGDVEAHDLSLEEARRWLTEAGFEALLRNGIFEFDEGSAA